MATMALVSGGKVMAQQKVADKELIGVWVMESMQWEGEEKFVCGETYTQVKFYGANGEYACAEVVKQKDGSCRVLPHEYGTYTFKNGVYTEMGRKTGPDGLKLIDKNTFTGVWQKRHDVWKKSTNMSEELRKYIVDKCKANQAPSADMQKLIKQFLFK